MGGRRRETWQTMELTVNDIDELIYYQRQMIKAFNKSNSKTEIQRLIQTVAVKIIMNKLKFSKTLSTLATAVKAVIDDVTATEIRSVKSTMEYGEDGLYYLKQQMTRRGYKKVTVEFGVLYFLDEGFKVISSDNYELISVDNMV